MQYYSIDLIDHDKTSWALHDVVKILPSQPRDPGLAPIFYKFFPSADVEIRMKPQYRHLCCKKCGRYDAEKMFKIGFDDPVTIRFKGDYGYTHDRIFVINDKFLKVLKKSKIGGYETKPLGRSGWHALHVTALVSSRDGVIKSRKPLCTECGRPKECFGLFQYINELGITNQQNTFFTTKTSWPRHFSDRDIFITEDVLQALKAAGINGGCCTRLLTDDELKKQKEKAKQGVNFWKPPGTSVFLNGRALKKK